MRANKREQTTIKKATVPARENSGLSDIFTILSFHIFILTKANYKNP